MDDVLLLRRVHNYTLDVNCFIDVGANQGMTSLAYEFLNHKDDNHILMFEPIENCSRSLNELCKINKNFTFYNLGIGDRKSVLLFNQSSSSPTSQFSSFKKFSKTYKKIVPSVNQPVSRYEVNILPLSDPTFGKILQDKTIFLHVDVEGFEYEVLNGLNGIRKSIKIIVVEISNNLFESTATVNDIVIYLSSTHSLIGCINAPMMRNGLILVQDYIFLKNDN